MVLKQQENIKPRNETPKVGRKRHVVVSEDLREFMERDARIMLCASSGQGTVYWYPGASTAGQYVLFKDKKEIFKHSDLDKVLEAYSFGVKEPKVAPENEHKRDVHTEHCCIHCGCKYGEEKSGCSVTTWVLKQSYPCTGDCNNW